MSSDGYVLRPFRWLVRRRCLTRRWLTLTRLLGLNVAVILTRCLLGLTVTVTLTLTAIPPRD
jgi:hypothetical protein